MQTPSEESSSLGVSGSQKRNAWAELNDGAGCSASENLAETRNFDDSDSERGAPEPEVELPGTPSQTAHSLLEPSQRADDPISQDRYDASQIVASALSAPSEPRSTVRPYSAPEREAVLEFEDENFAGAVLESESDEFEDDDEFDEHAMYDHNHGAGFTGTRGQASPWHGRVHVALPDDDFEGRYSRSSLERQPSLDWHDSDRPLGIAGEVDEHRGLIDSHFKQLISFPSAPLQQRYKVRRLYSKLVLWIFRAYAALGVLADLIST
eukprot:1716480-Rhodomonas_salina.2